MDKKKIGIITIHTDFNYGAVLQAIATQKFLEIQGYDAELIDYENPVIAEQSKIAYKQGGKFKGYILTFIRNTIYGRYFYYKKAIQDLDKYRKKSKQRFDSLNKLNQVDYEVLIAGSDQIWNPVISRGIDPAFLLQFGNPKKKISVSTSMGSYQLNAREKKFFHKALASFDAISVREQFAKDQLQDLVGKSIKVLCDPTLFLSGEIWWNDFAKFSKYADLKKDYIVTYFVGANKVKYKAIISDYAKNMNLPVWTIQYSNYNWKESDKKILGASIIDFIALIANARLVITDSFHGVVFSLNMQTNFVALTNSENPVRVREFLEKLNEDKRIDMKPENYKDVDFEKVNGYLKEIRQDSINWVIEALDN